MGLLSRHRLMASNPGTSTSASKRMSVSGARGMEASVESPAGGDRGDRTLPPHGATRMAFRQSLAGGAGAGAGGGRESLGGGPKDRVRSNMNPTYSEGGVADRASQKPKLAQVVQASLASRLLELNAAGGWGGDEAGPSSGPSFNNRPWELNGISYLKHYAGWAERDPKKRSSINVREKSLADVVADLEQGGVGGGGGGWVGLRERSSLFERVPLQQQLLAQQGQPLSSDQDRATAPVRSNMDRELREIHSTGPERTHQIISPEASSPIRPVASYQQPPEASSLIRPVASNQQPPGGSRSGSGSGSNGTRVGSASASRDLPLGTRLGSSSGVAPGRGALDSIGSNTRMRRVEERLQQGGGGSSSGGLGGKILRPKPTLKELEEEIEGVGDSFRGMDEEQLKSYLEQNKTLKK